MSNTPSDKPAMTAPDASMNMGAAPAPPPMPQPIDPNQPAQTQPGAVPPMQPQPKKGMSKGLLWGLIGGGIGLVVIIIAVILAIVFLGGPSRDDYNKAVSVIDDINDSLRTSSVSSSSDPDELRQNIDEMFDEMDKGNEKLVGMKALRDSEAKSLYDSYKKSYDKAKPKLNNLVTAVTAYRGISQDCRYVSTPYLSTYNKTGEEVGVAFDNAYKNCFTTLNKYTSSDVDSVKSYANAYKDYYQRYRSYLVARANKDYSATYPSYPTVTAPHTKIMSEFKGTEIDSKLRELRTYLKNKAKGKSILASYTVE